MTTFNMKLYDLWKGKSMSPLKYRDDKILEKLKETFKAGLVSFDRPNYNMPSPYYGVTIKIDMNFPVNMVYGKLSLAVMSICGGNMPKVTIDPFTETARYVVPL